MQNTHKTYKVIKYELNQKLN